MPTTGPRLERHEGFASRFLPDARDLIVYLPPGYSRTRTRRYPVLYLQDGQNLFEPETAFIRGQHWRVGETADYLIDQGQVDPLIIVGIQNTGASRTAEYTPTLTRRHGGGQADAYGQLLLEEIRPFIDSRYRTRRDGASTGLGGSSLGGLVALYLGLRHPQAFGRLAILSPSVWWDRRVILREVRAARPLPRARIWLDMGTAERSRPQDSRKSLDDTRLLKAGLVKAGWVEEETLRYREYAGANHSEAAWAERVGPMLEWLFPGRG
ncbi:MAG: alpha/beta hydrolase [Vicinamibacterales bacterium]